MTLENFKLIIDQSKDYVNQVALGGKGDPNLHPDFLSVISYALRNNIIPNYTTSGNSLTDEQIEISKMCGAVAVSDYNQSFTYSALNRFINAGIKTNIHFVLSTERFDRAIDILNGIDIWNNQFDISKLNAIIFLLFKPQGRSKGRYDLIPSNDQVKIFIKKIREPKVKFKLGMDSCLVNKLSLLDNLTESESIFLDTCEASRASMYITPDMMAVPCSFADYSDNGVLITKDNPIKEIWANSESFNRCRGLLNKCRNKCPYMENK
jgi:MoaA/NifB/PqqE/SkfB family radical SAM enzyme